MERRSNLVRRHVKAGRVPLAAAFGHIRGREGPHARPRVKEAHAWLLPGEEASHELADWHGRHELAQLAPPLRIKKCRRMDANEINSREELGHARRQARLCGLLRVAIARLIYLAAARCLAGLRRSLPWTRRATQSHSVRASRRALDSHRLIQHNPKIGAANLPRAIASSQRTPPSLSRKWCIYIRFRSIAGLLSLLKAHSGEFVPAPRQHHEAFQEPTNRSREGLD